MVMCACAARWNIRVYNVWFREFDMLRHIAFSKGWSWRSHWARAIADIAASSRLIRFGLTDIVKMAMHGLTVRILKVHMYDDELNPGQITLGCPAFLTCLPSCRFRLKRSNNEIQELTVHSRTDTLINKFALTRGLGLARSISTHPLKKLESWHI